jgi:predicted urease superfamily metal-dependent hydrolase
VEFTRNAEKATRVAMEITEAQRDASQALTENLAAAQGRGVGLAQGATELLRLQEQNAKAAEQWFAASMRVARLQQRNVSFAQEWLRNGAEALREQTEHNVRTAEAFARSARKQQEVFQVFAEGWGDAYEAFFSPFRYAQEGLRTFQRAAEQGANVTQRVVEQAADATEQVRRQGLRVVEETAERTEEVLRETEEATREAELRASVHAALQTENYEGLTVAEVTGKLDDLSVEQLRRVREFEKRTKDRESLVERIDSKIRANS